MAEHNVTLRVKGVSKRFGDFSAVEDLSFEVRAGRVFGFLGPNGAGKTTTIRMIVGITVPDEGSIELFGQKISPTLQDRIGYLPEERARHQATRCHGGIPWDWRASRDFHRPSRSQRA